MALRLNMSTDVSSEIVVNGQATVRMMMNSEGEMEQHVLNQETYELHEDEITEEIQEFKELVEASGGTVLPSKPELPVEPEEDEEDEEDEELPPEDDSDFGEEPPEED